MVSRRRSVTFQKDETFIWRGSTWLEVGLNKTKGTAPSFPTEFSYLMAWTSHLDPDPQGSQVSKSPLVSYRTLESVGTFCRLRCLKRGKKLAILDFHALFWCICLWVTKMVFQMRWSASLVQHCNPCAPLLKLKPITAHTQAATLSSAV